MSFTTPGLPASSWRSWPQILVLMSHSSSIAGQPGVPGEANRLNLAFFPTISGYVCLNLGLQFPRPVHTAPMPNWPADGKRGQEIDTPWGKLRNDLEPAVLPKYLFLALLKDWLKQQSETVFALMSGSGSTIFAIVRSQGGRGDASSPIPDGIR